MRKSDLTLRAASEQAALEQAAAELDALPENIEIVPLEDGEFRAALKNADAEVEIEISEDGMEARISALAPAIGAGAPLSAESLAAELKRAGIVVDPDPQAIQQVLEGASSGEDIRDLVVARGLLPRPATEVRIELLGDLEGPVFPGDVFARRIPAQNPEAGQTVQGQRAAAPGKEKARTPPVRIGDGCMIDQDSNISARKLGIARLAGDVISVRPLIEVSKDNLQVIATIYPLDFRGAPITLERFCRGLVASGIRAEPDEEAIRSALARAKDKAEPVPGVLVAAGVPPTHGKDGLFDRQVETDQSVGTVQDDGRIDFYERSIVNTVERGEILGRIVPPDKGTPGTDVLGKVVQARDGRPATISVGRNVESSGDKLELRARVAGMVALDRGILSVLEICEIQDVDFSTGNIRMEEGTVRVKGTIRSGFTVTAGSDIVVGDTIENATAVAGGNVQVRNGILMKDEGLVKAKGDVTARFARNARIEADGDVVIDNVITNCHIRARGKVISVRGKGCIRGGTVQGGGGVEAKEIGSELGVATTVIVGLKREVHDELLAKRAELQETIRKIDVALGTEEDTKVLQRTPERKRDAVEKLLEARIGARRRLEEVEEALAEEKKRLKEQTKARVKAQRVIHPGVIVIIAGCRMEVREEMRSCQLYYDPKEDVIRDASYS